MAKGAKGCLGNTTRAQEEQSTSTLLSLLISVWPDLPSHCSLLLRLFVALSCVMGSCLSFTAPSPGYLSVLTVLCLDAMYEGGSEG